jgi:transcriptional regulator with XRE-family HTH domain
MPRAISPAVARPLVLQTAAMPGTPSIDVGRRVRGRLVNRGEQRVVELRQQTERAMLKDNRDRRRARPQDIDRHIGARMRERRVMLGLTQQQMAELIGVTYQQAHKYEKGINRVSGGRLFKMAQALGVEVGYFYDGLGADGGSFEPTQQQRLLLELARSFIALPRRHQEAVCGLVRAVADPNHVPAAGFDFGVVDQGLAAA